MDPVYRILYCSAPWIVKFVHGKASEEFAINNNVSNPKIDELRMNLIVTLVTSLNSIN